ncbi:Mediator of RNA polymerase II transcription subunit 7 [Vermiconidia calcicola]|uniref:Mediator of RNA polymerase II transcription subunit 7 n=1 Tax=Vermiconidia calcicola TaxID=1690605 RepID=A0ACC3MPW7_9PEZI|nr:Mediator of RNA polymerase II transcription subunit 7 [Vermiconidia calcicola]
MTLSGISSCIPAYGPYLGSAVLNYDSLETRHTFVGRITTMAEQQQQQQQQQATISAPFPAPPPFYKHFTKPNLAQLRQIRRETANAQQQPHITTNGSNDSKPDIDILSLPPELRYLLPPPPPQDDKYRTLGAPQDPNAPDEGLKPDQQLYPLTANAKLNPQPHLIALARSLLTTFLSLVGILSKNPQLYAEKVNDLEMIMRNMHDLINQYRPHQARETLILMMEERVERLRGKVGRIREVEGRVGKLMEGLREGGEVEEGKLEDGEGGGKRGDGDVMEERWREKQRMRWRAMEEEMAG